MQRPLYMQPADALAYGVIDGVVTPEKQVSRCLAWAVVWCRQGSFQRRTPLGAALLCRGAEPLRLASALHCETDTSSSNDRSTTLPLSRPVQIIDDVKSADQWDKEAGLVAR